MKYLFNLIFKKKDSNLEISDFFFRIFFIIFLVIFILEALFPGFATNWFNPIWLLLFAIVFLIISLSKKTL